MNPAKILINGQHETVDLDSAGQVKAIHPRKRMHWTRVVLVICALWMFAVALLGLFLWLRGYGGAGVFLPLAGTSLVAAVGMFNSAIVE